ncbi:MAG: 4Fe-4S dicluster domain-containing protein [Acidimicrobiia bacterium]
MAGSVGAAAMIAVGLPLESVGRAVDHWVGHRPLLRAERCTTARHERAGCRACQDACPPGALRIDPEHRLVQIDSDACTGCDACVCACPTAALTSRAATPPSGVIACHPAVDTMPAASVVPCAASLTAATLLELATGGDVVVIVGDCATCPTAAGSAVAARVAAVNRTVAALGSTHRVTVRGAGDEPSAPRPPRTDPAAPATPPGSRHGGPVSRRAFFRFAGLGLRETAGAAMDTGDEPDVLAWADPAREARTSGVGAALATLAAHAGAASTAGLGLGTPSIHGDCDLCGACAAFCPTAALRLVADGAGASLDVDVTACAACGLCETIWPPPGTARHGRRRRGRPGRGPASPAPGAAPGTRLSEGTDHDGGRVRRPPAPAGGGPTPRSPDMNLGPTELIMVLAVLMLLFGASRVPKLARSLGEASREFRKGVEHSDDDHS